MTAQPGSVLSLPTPLARLYGAAMAMDLHVADADPSDLWEDGLLAVVAFADTISIRPGLGDDALRADALAMGIVVTALMTPAPGAAPGGIYAPDGYVFIWDGPAPAPTKGTPAALAALCAAKCGHTLTPRQWEVPELEPGQP